MRGLIVQTVGAHVADVGISQTDNLPGIAGVGENFLVTGEAGIENDFAAAARDCAGRTAVKYAPVFQRKNRGSMLNFGQWLPLCWSSKSQNYLLSTSVNASEPK